MLPLNDRYSCQVSDSKHYSENVVFPPSLSSFVKKHLQEGMIIEIGKYSLKDFQHNNAAKSKALEIETFKPIKEVNFVIGDPEPLPKCVPQTKVQSVRKNIASTETPIARKTRSKKPIKNSKLIS